MKDSSWPGVAGGGGLASWLLGGSGATSLQFTFLPKQARQQLEGVGPVGLGVPLGPPPVELRLVHRPHRALARGQPAPPAHREAIIFKKLLFYGIFLKWPDPDFLFLCYKTICISFKKRKG